MIKSTPSHRSVAHEPVPVMPKPQDVAEARAQDIPLPELAEVSEPVADAPEEKHTAKKHR